MPWRVLVAAWMLGGLAWLSAAEPPADPAPPAAPANQPAAAANQLAGTADGNLIPNGDFEAGTITPDHWQTIDGLSTFWVEDPDPGHGKVLKVDTDILQSQAYEWWAQIFAGASPEKAPIKLPTIPPKYDTLAGLDGVWFWSDFVPVEKGKSYWLTLDAKGPAAMLVWLVGYPEKTSLDFGADAAAFQGYLKKQTDPGAKLKRGNPAFIHKYVFKGQLSAGGSADWKTFSRREKPFSPTKFTPTVKYVRVMLYPFWPPGEYYVDNVRLVEHEPPRKSE